MAQLSSIRPVAFDVAGAIDSDLICRRCGYNLRGLKPEGICPECAAPISDSLRDDRLADADSAWLSLVARGLGLVFWIAIAKSLSVFFYAGLSETYLSVSDPQAGGYTLILWFDLLLVIFGLIGLWRATAREPRRHETPWQPTWRTLARALVVAELSTVFLRVSLFHFGELVWWQARSGQLIFAAGALLGVLAFLQAPVERGGRPRLEDTLSAGLAGSAGLVITTTLSMLLVNLVRLGEGLLIGLILLLGIGLLAGFIWLMTMLYWIGRLFEAASRN